jgi:DNA polymerase III alpha subunit
MKNFVSAINHPESPWSGSTIESMINRSKKLGCEYFSVTDNGYFNSVLKSYMYGKEEKIKIIAGVDAYFRDRNCPIVKNTPAENIKYYKIILHAIDQDSYQNLARICSNFNKKTITVMDNEYPLIDWADLEYLSTLNITASTSDIEDIVTKNLLVDRPDIALEYFKKLNTLFGDRYYPALIN